MSVLLSILVAVSPVVVAAIVGVITYSRQKGIDRKNELRHRKMKEYERYLTAHRGLTSLTDFDRNLAPDSPEVIKAHNEYWLAYSTLFLIASDDVLEAVMPFHLFARMDEPHLRAGDAWNDKFKELYSDMIKEMREDAFEAFEKTELKKKLGETPLPFDFSYTTKVMKTGAGPAQPDKTEQASNGS